MRSSPSLRIPNVCRPGFRSLPSVKETPKKNWKILRQVMDHDDLFLRLVFVLNASSKSNKRGICIFILFLCYIYIWYMYDKYVTHDDT